jgi:transposase
VLDVQLNLTPPAKKNRPAARRPTNRLLATFAREFGFFPHACNPASGWEKGKIERAIGYLRQNFWPLREFTDLHDINRQVRQWLAEVANQRLHRETRERPLEREQELPHV